MHSIDEYLTCIMGDFYTSILNSHLPVVTFIPEPPHPTLLRHTASTIIELHHPPQQALDLLSIAFDSHICNLYCGRELGRYRQISPSTREFHTFALNHPCSRH